MRYHLCKVTRVYDGEPYCGPTSKGQPAGSDSLEEAVQMAKFFDRVNPVGWNVWDSETGQVVHGKNLI